MEVNMISRFSWFLNKRTDEKRAIFKAFNCLVVVKLFPLNMFSVKITNAPMSEVISHYNTTEEYLPNDADLDALNCALCSLRNVIDRPFTFSSPLVLVNSTCTKSRAVLRCSDCIISSTTDFCFYNIKFWFCSGNNLYVNWDTEYLCDESNCLPFLKDFCTQFLKESYDFAKRCVNECFV